ncbi:MAG: tRNA (adenosine(37)-N6)-threonylcarbamoyltransferase complex ATPase subunit type 1 TsaE [Deltaproteobacteria bacterium]|jgi:tRNA threonylcarbamoyladenosine biosynthesis protein TsaE|nr:tRNA (adenosine(37)-N6)-threonylcarbamoyltransferase complex ATPase subunit type 1 TsaE [Deltaproteobacteria bacterium]
MGLFPDIFLESPHRTHEIGGIVAEILKRLDQANLIITLDGPLGVGKTTFVQGFGEAWGLPAQEVVSPTFALLHQYQGEQKSFSHLDLYRLGAQKDASPEALEEFYAAGLEEFLEGIVLVEWPKRLPLDFWPQPRLEVLFHYLPGPSSTQALRYLNFRGFLAPEIYQEIERGFPEKD